MVNLSAWGCPEANLGVGVAPSNVDRLKIASDSVALLVHACRPKKNSLCFLHALSWHSKGQRLLLVDMALEAIGLCAAEGPTTIGI